MGVTLNFNNDNIGLFICKFRGAFVLFHNDIGGQKLGVTLDFFIMADVGNLDTYLGVYFSLFL